MKHPEAADLITRNWDLYYDKILEWRDNTLIPLVKGWLVTASGYVVKFFSAIWNIIIGLIISIYIVAGKEKLSAQFKKVFYGILGTNTANHLITNVRFTNDKFSGFIVGKLVDSLIIGIITLICCYIFKFDYPVLIALIIGVTNIIPFFGPIFGAIPCFILLFMINPIKSLYFILFVIVIQQFDGNVLGPKILGQSTGVSGLWVIVSITFFGGIWNVPGMIIGVPLFAVIYAAFKTVIERSLKKKSLPVETNNYYNLNYIDPNDNKLILHTNFYHINKASIKAGHINVREILHKRYLRRSIKDYFKKKK
jgi:predicted PurR-regulated permease PerM